MRMLFIIVGILIFGALVWYGVRMGLEKKEPVEPLEEPTTEQGVNEQQQQAEPEGEVVTTEEGLIYQDVTIGEGAEAQAGDTVTVHYVGQLEDGTVFDASTQRGEPFTFALGAGNVIKGWDIGVAGMQVGGMRVLQIPSHLAYGEQGQGPIPPDATLIFQVQLLKIEK